ncbi:hypothetical protein [Nocardiopsis synnemataformans]|uniref:hypothetical protein n=1 Tax=Nocardiopsis synnemataformans TaxID=61305 RepID=UPI003EB8ADFA
MSSIMLTRCEGCTHNWHPAPFRPHTWVGQDDAAHLGLPWPLPEDEARRRPCACQCAGGPGGCVTADQAVDQAAARGDWAEVVNLIGQAVKATWSTEDDSDA